MRSHTKQYVAAGQSRRVRERHRMQTDVTRNAPQQYYPKLRLSCETRENKYYPKLRLSREKQTCYSNTTQHRVRRAKRAGKTHSKPPRAIEANLRFQCVYARHHNLARNERTRSDQLFTNGEVTSRNLNACRAQRVEKNKRPQTAFVARNARKQILPQTAFVARSARKK